MTNKKHKNTYAKAKPKKLYCYVDETGQDARSNIFILVAIIANENPTHISEELRHLEIALKLYNTKWHKSSHPLRIRFIQEFISKYNFDLSLYFMLINKPVIYHLSIIEILCRAITEENDPDAQAIIFIDGLDKLSGKKITAALRTRNFKIKLVKGVRDESEPLIRLADRWAGCIRMAISGNEQCRNLVFDAQRKSILKKK